MSIQKLMTKELVHVGPDESIGEMQRLFISLPLHHLLVMEDGTLLGVVSDRDVLKHISPFTDTQLESAKDRYASSIPASRIMNTKYASITQNMSLREVAKTMLDNSVELVPVIDECKKVLGVVSWKDLLRYLTE